MLEFIIHSLTRLLSGIKQAYFYDKNWYHGIYFSIYMIVAYVIWAIINGNPYGFIVPVLAAINYTFLAYVFYKGKEKQVHTLEYLGNYIFNFGAFFFGGDLVGLVMGIYVGGFLFNAPIQKQATGNYINEVSITNDPTGKTTNFFLFGKEFKVRNLLTSGYHQMYAAIASTIIYLILYYKNVHYYFPYETIKDLLNI